MKTPDNNIPLWLGDLLDRRQMSVEKLADRCGLSRALIYAYMTDRNRPSANSMGLICIALGVPLEEGLAQYTPRVVGRRPFS